MLDITFSFKDPTRSYFDNFDNFNNGGYDNWGGLPPILPVTPLTMALFDDDEMAQETDQPSVQPSVFDPFGPIDSTYDINSPDFISPYERELMMQEERKNRNNRY